MLEIYKDSSIHKDGIYDIDESCYIRTNSYTTGDNIIILLLALFVIFK